MNVKYVVSTSTCSTLVEALMRILESVTIPMCLITRLETMASLVARGRAREDMITRGSGREVYLHHYSGHSYLHLLPSLRGSIRGVTNIHGCSR